MAGKGGGAWKVAYADFVTAMMAFFLVMWITAQSDQIKHAIAQHFNDPFSKESEEDGAAHQRPPRHPAPARTTDRPQHEKEAGGTHSLLLTTKGGERTSIGIVVHFTDDSAELDQEAQRRLADIAPLLVGKPQKVEVRGHSSRRPLPEGSPYRDHWHLAYDRCLAVKEALQKLGIAPERIRLSQAAGYEPLAAPNDQFAGGGYSRVEVTLLNETTGTRVAQQATTKSVKITEAKHNGPATADRPPMQSDSHNSANGHSDHSHGT